MKVYLSGKMSGLPDCNYPKFDEVENELLNQGFDVVNPANIGRATIIPEGLTEKEEYQIYLSAAIKGMLTCNTIYMLKGWRNSFGANFELELAIFLGFKVMYE